MAGRLPSIGGRYSLNRLFIVEVLRSDRSLRFDHVINQSYLMYKKKGIVGVTRVNSKAETLNAWIKHHLPMVDAIVVVIDVRSEGEGQKALDICHSYRGVTPILSVSAMFVNSITLAKCLVGADDAGYDITMHIDSDEFVGWEGRIETMADDIRIGKWDYAEAAMVDRFTEGFGIAQGEFNSIEELRAACPVSTGYTLRYGLPSVKCWLNRSPYCYIHEPSSYCGGWKKHPMGMHLEHYKWINDVMGSASEKQAHHPKGIKFSVGNICWHAKTQSRQFINQCKKGLRTGADLLPKPNK